MKVEFIPKEKEPILTFNDIANGSVFKFTGEDSNGNLWLKTGTATAMQVRNTKEIIPVKASTIIEYFESHIVVKGN